MPLFVLLLLFQSGRLERLFEKRIDDTHIVSMLRESTREKVTLHLRIAERADRNGYWTLETFNSPYTYELVRADRGSVVLRSVTDYGFTGPYVKLFFDLMSKKVLKRIEYTDTALSQISKADAQSALGAPAEIINLFQMPFESLSPFETRTLPQEFMSNALPQSTYAEFARARPGRVRDGYVKDGTSIEEVIGPYQVVGEKIWFGKSFYDGEGMTGVGAIGYLDRMTKKYTFIRLREVTDWSVSNLLVEGDTLWASLVTHPEGADHSGGLIRHDLKTGVTRKYPVDEVIHRMQRAGDGLYLSTSNGIYVLKNERLTRYLIEPDINGKPVIISEEQ